MIYSLSLFLCVERQRCNHEVVSLPSPIKMWKPMATAEEKKFHFAHSETSAAREPKLMPQRNLCAYEYNTYRVTGKECNLEHLSMYLVK